MNDRDRQNDMKDTCAICRELLPEYAGDELSDTLKNSVDKHLATCPACQQTLRMLQMISQERSADDDPFGAHLPPETLAQYALQPESMTSSERRSAEEHLRGCDVCEAELLFVRNVDRDISPHAVFTSRRLKAASFRDRVQAVFSHPVVAYAILLIVLIPAILWVAQRDRTASTSVITEYTGPVELRTMTRSTANIPAVTVLPDTPAVLFDIPLTRVKAEFDYTFAVVDLQTETPVDAPAIPVHDSTGSTGLLVDCARLSPGIYYLRVTEIDRASGEMVTRRDFAFKVK